MAAVIVSQFLSYQSSIQISPLMPFLQLVRDPLTLEPTCPPLTETPETLWLTTNGILCRQRAPFI